MKFWKRSAIAVAFVALSLATVGSFAQDEWAPEEMTGIKVGENAPDFTLTNVDGAKYTLSDLTKKGTVALMFYRSANW